MGVIKDLTGQKFGSLTVLEITNERRNRQVVWKCQCDCGNITYVVGQALRSLHTTSCGCSFHKLRAEDLTGQVFGKLTVIERDFSKQTQSRIAFWKCQCECGNFRIVDSSSLRNGSIIQCHNCATINRTQPDFSTRTGPIKNLIGNRYGKLVVQEMTNQKDNAGHIIWKCQCDCGKICQVASNRLTTYNTLSCGCLKTSAGEELIKNILIKNNINFISQYSFDDCISPKNSKLFFDFAVFDKYNKLAYLIEFDGQQHFIPVKYFGDNEQFEYNQLCDQIKNNYCKEHQILLIRIPYTKKANLTQKDVIINDYL